VLKVLQACQSVLLTVEWHFCTHFAHKHLREPLEDLHGTAASPDCRQEEHVLHVRQKEQIGHRLLQDQDITITSGNTSVDTG